MLRTAIKPRNLALLAVAVLVVIAFIQAGRWQARCRRGRGAEGVLAKARSQQPVAVETVLQPHSEFPGVLSTRPVSATGEFGTDQVVVANRRLDGRIGYWVVAPLRVEASGATLPVLRGFVTSPTDLPPVPSGTVTVTGGLAPPESPYAGESPPQGQARLGRHLRPRRAVARRPLQRLRLPAGESPAAAPSSLGTMERVPTPSGETGFKWRNAAYALQWWAFAGFALYMWWRIVRDEGREDAAARKGGAAAAGTGRGGDNGGRE